MATRYELSTIKYDEERHQVKIPYTDYDKKTNTYSEKYYGAVRGVSTVELLLDLELMIHIQVDDEEKLYEIANNLENPAEYLSLGRREDLVRIDEVKIVELEERELEEDICLSYDAYIPTKFLEKNKESISKLDGTVFKITKDYKLKEISKGKFIRDWNKVEVVHGVMERSEFNEDACVLMDDDNNLVFLA